MWAHSSRWSDTISRSHDVFTIVDFLIDGDVAVTIDGSDQDLIVSAAQVQVADGAVRRTASMTVVDVGGVLTPVADEGLVIPGQSEIRIWAGIRYWDATSADDAAGTAVEVVPVFTGPISSVDLSNYPQVSLNASDRMFYVQQPFSAPYTVRGGTQLDDAIVSLLRAKVSPNKLQANLPATDLTTSVLIYDEQADPADAIRTLGTAAGWTVYCDQMGVFNGQTEPQLDPDAVVFSYEAGPGGALILPKLTYDIQNVVNTWVVTGESASQTALVPYAKVVDDDPTSVTYVRGPYDERPRFISSPILRTDAQCLLAAKTYRARERGLSGSVVASVLPNPALDKGDVVSVTGGLVDQLLIVDSFNFDCLGGSQDLVGRSAVLETSSG